MQASDSTRVLMYSHDTYGLGHITRTLRIARALRDRYEHASILVLSGSPVAPYMPLPSGSDLVKLPSVVKSGPDTYRSRDLEVSFSQIKKIRRDLILGTAEAFRPHLFLVDNVPLGMKSEVLPTLRALRADSPSTRIVLNLRDILDDPDVIRETWKKDGVPEVLDSCYDRIFVLGDDRIFDAAAAYRLPAGKVTHVGYAAPSQRRIAMGQGRSAASRPNILLTAGGGGDGAEFLGIALEGMAALARTAPPRSAVGRMRVEVVTGPLMVREERQRLAEMARSYHVVLHEFVPDMARRMADADLVVAMAGYNTCCEILSHARSALVLPRVKPRVEQLLRARAFQARGLVTAIEPSEATPDGVAGAVRRILENDRPIAPSSLPAMDGLSRLAEMLGELCPSLYGRAHRSSTAAAAVKVARGFDGDPNGRGPTHGAMGRESFWFWPGITAPARAMHTAAIARRV